jgi:hypothetical protein
MECTYLTTAGTRGMGEHRTHLKHKFTLLMERAEWRKCTGMLHGEIRLVLEQEQSTGKSLSGSTCYSSRHYNNIDNTHIGHTRMGYMSGFDIR